ncbi:MAG: hypothetical protein ACK45X_05680 [Roseiflexaceae bacterium]
MWHLTPRKPNCARCVVYWG